MKQSSERETMKTISNRKIIQKIIGVHTHHAAETATKNGKRIPLHANVIGPVLILLVFCLAGCSTPRSPVLRTLHTYGGDFRPANELVHIRVVSPIKVSFVDDVPLTVTGGEILALLPGMHTLIAGCPTKQHSGIDMADRIATGLSENKEIPVVGRAGDLFTLGSEADDSLSGVSMTINGMTIPLPTTYRAQLVLVSNHLDAASFFTGISTAVTARLTIPFLGNPTNGQDLKKLQGRWRVIGINMEGEDYTTDEYRKRAMAKGGDSSLLDMALEIKRLRMKWVGEKVRGESVIVEIDSSRSPKFIRALSVGDSDNQTCGIYDLQGDILKFCFGATTPRSFTSAPEMARLSFVLQRETKGQANKEGVK